MPGGPRKNAWDASIGRLRYDPRPGHHTDNKLAEPENLQHEPRGQTEVKERSQIGQYHPHTLFPHRHPKHRQA